MWLQYQIQYQNVYKQQIDILEPVVIKHTVKSLI